MSRDHTRLDVFHLAHRLAVDVYHLSAKLPQEERFGLRSQLRRAAVSIPANIVEGCVRHSARDYARFVDIALGSAVELRYLLDLIIDLDVLARDAVVACRTRSDSVVRALQNLRKAIGRFDDRT